MDDFQGYPLGIGNLQAWDDDHNIKQISDIQNFSYIATYHITYTIIYIDTIIYIHDSQIEMNDVCDFVGPLLSQVSCLHRQKLSQLDVSQTVPGTWISAEFWGRRHGMKEWQHNGYMLYMCIYIYMCVCMYVCNTHIYMYICMLYV